MEDTPTLVSGIFRKRALALLVVLFFAVQLFGIVAGRFTNVKYFSWAPYDQISMYKIDVKKDGRTLSRNEVRNRYHIAARGRENRSIHNIISIVRQYENTNGMDDGVNISISYTINGHHSETWVWPDDEINRK